jgi:hypothetical protein
VEQNSTFEKSGAKSYRFSYGFLTWIFAPLFSKKWNRRFLAQPFPKVDKKLNLKTISYLNVL